ncbi:hypothetical protein J2755_000938 [Methanohalophilus levihalophilus]|uniref:hypothetical protein n=1 Tax=Methanohalophilus levihalophilus TaxID=1431282 RepID=UPI001AE22361|nr:hypothetical protein [Methanohalophilus levihalophilus]MBP2030004.1 hypothetical protein [Methanohalophilus levihalophilus]
MNENAMIIVLTFAAVAILTFFVGPSFSFHIFEILILDLLLISAGIITKLLT